MERDLELDLLRRLLALHESRSTSEAALPRRQCTSVYVDAGRLQAEVETLLRGQPLIAGLSAELAGPGAYFTADVGALPVLVVRTRDGRVRAFLNVCRHRGSTVAIGRGEGSTGFVCRYHGWSYGLDGSLKGRPLARDAFDKLDGCSNLIELPCAEDCGLIVIGTSPSTKVDVRALLGGFADELASLALGNYRLVGTQDKIWPFNWKLGFETFLEGYHIFSLHRDSLGQQLKSAPMLSEFCGPHGRGLVMGNKCAELRGKPESEWQRFGCATLVYWLFPNTVLSMPQSGHAELWSFVPLAAKPESCAVSVRFFAAPTAPHEDAFWQRLIAYTMGVVESEDFGQQVLIQRNLAAGLLEETVFGRNEPALIHFHQQLDALLGSSGTSSLSDSG